MSITTHLNEIIKDVDYHINKIDDDEEKAFLRNISDELESVKRGVVSLERK